MYSFESFSCDPGIQSSLHTERGHVIVPPRCTSEVHALDSVGNVRKKYIIRGLALGGLLCVIRTFQWVRSMKCMHGCKDSELPAQREYISQVFEGTRTSNVKVVRPGRVI